MKVASLRLDTVAVDKVLQAWVEIGGNDPGSEISAEIVSAIQHVVETNDQYAQFSLANGYRFGSKVGFDKLCFTVRGNQVVISTSDSYGNEGKPERLKAIREAHDLFQRKLQEIFGDEEATGN